MMNVVITGASRGLGKAMAEKFADNGHALYLCSKQESVLQLTVKELQDSYPKLPIKARSCDLADKKQATEFGEWVIREGENQSPGFHVDILINNAGRFLPGNIGSEPEGTLDDLLLANLFSAYQVTRAILPNMLARRKGHIFNICSIASLQAYPNGGAYSISKFALAGFSKNLREELKNEGIKVTTVYPGAVYTSSWAGSGVEPSRIMEVTDIADLVFSASQLSPQATVEDIVIRPLLGDL